MMFWWQNDEENHDFHVDGDNKDNCPDKDDNVAGECVQSLSCFTSICFDGNEYKIVQNIDYIEGGDLISSLPFFEENPSTALSSAPFKHFTNVTFFYGYFSEIFLCKIGIFINVKIFVLILLQVWSFSMTISTNVKQTYIILWNYSPFLKKEIFTNVKFA